MGRTVKDPLGENLCAGFDSWWYHGPCLSSMIRQAHEVYRCLLVEMLSWPTRSNTSFGERPWQSSTRFSDSVTQPVNQGGRKGNSRLIFMMQGRVGFREGSAYDERAYGTRSGLRGNNEDSVAREFLVDAGHQ